MDKLLSIEKAAELLSVSTGTLRRWEREGKLIPVLRFDGVKQVVEDLDK